MSEGLPLGFVLTDMDGSEPLESNGRVLRPVGYVHSLDEFVVVEDQETGSTWIVDVVSGEATPLNRDLHSTRLFLEAFARYLRSGPKDVPVSTMTADQAAERLARFRAGERLPPPSAAPPAVPHRARIRELRKALERADPAATAAASWWHRAIEQAADDLL